jgi:D-alanyl-D-alanine dipeptidase
MAGDREIMNTGENQELSLSPKVLHRKYLHSVTWTMPPLAWLLVLAACGQAQSQSRINAPPAPIASAALAESLLVDVRQVDSSIAVNLRYLTSDNFTGAPLPGYEANRAYLRREAAAALAKVQEHLRAEGLGLLIWDAYRPVSGTEGMVAWAERTGNMKYFKQGYIARRSRHNMGVAVDLTLVSIETGKPLDMGTPFDTFSGAAHTASATGTAAQNRQRLVSAMEAQGFKNYDQEWWHFSFEVPNPVPFDVPVR